MTDQEFEDVVGDALDRIPADLAEAIDNVVVLVQDEPDPEMLTEEDYDEAGLPTLLGFALRKTVPLVFIPVRGATTSKAPGPHRLAA